MEEFDFGAQTNSHESWWTVYMYLNYYNLLQV